MISFLIKVSLAVDPSIRNVARFKWLLQLEKPPTLGSIKCNSCEYADDKEDDEENDDEDDDDVWWIAK